jgi:IS5 family transposase
MEVVVPWQPLIEPHYPKTSKKGGRLPYQLATMLRIHLKQQWYSISDLAWKMPCRRLLSVLVLLFRQLA